MKFGIAFANAGPFASPELFESLVRNAEEAGFESLWTVEHVVVPVGYASPYPYSESGRMPGPEDSPIPDPILPLAYAAALTSRIRLATGILILPQRHPAYVAKEMATLDVLSRGRAILGVGIGWLEEEFRVVGVPFRERAPRTEEAIRAVRSLWRGSRRPSKAASTPGPRSNRTPSPCSPAGSRWSWAATWRARRAGRRAAATASSGARRARPAARAPRGAARRVREDRARSRRGRARRASGARIPTPSAATRTWASSGS